jgi:hypothetical protein
MDNLISDDELKQFIISLFDSINQDLERRSGFKSKLTITEKLINQSIKELKSSALFPKLTKKDLQFNEFDKKLAIAGFLLAGSVFLNQVQLNKIRNSESKLKQEELLFDISENSFLSNTTYEIKKKVFFNLMDKFIKNSNFVNMSAVKLLNLSKGIPEDFVTGLRVM